MLTDVSEWVRRRILKTPTVATVAFHGLARPLRRRDSLKTLKGALVRLRARRALAERLREALERPLPVGVQLVVALRFYVKEDVGEGWMLAWSGSLKLSDPLGRKAVGLFLTRALSGALETVLAEAFEGALGLAPAHYHTLPACLTFAERSFATRLRRLLAERGQLAQLVRFNLILLVLLFASLFL